MSSEDLEYWIERVDGYVVVAYGDGLGYPIHVRAHGDLPSWPTEILVVTGANTDSPTFLWGHWWVAAPGIRTYVEGRVIDGYRAKTEQQVQK